jgi:hypothetical protein
MVEEFEFLSSPGLYRITSLDLEGIDQLFEKMKALRDTRTFAVRAESGIRELLIEIAPEHQETFYRNGTGSGGHKPGSIEHLRHVACRAYSSCDCLVLKQAEYLKPSALDELRDMSGRCQLSIILLSHFEFKLSPDRRKIIQDVNFVDVEDFIEAIDAAYSAALHRISEEREAKGSSRPDYAPLLREAKKKYRTRQSQE